MRLDFNRAVYFDRLISARRFCASPPANACVGPIPFALTLLAGTPCLTI